MRELLRTTKPTPFNIQARPAGLGGHCDHYHRNPDLFGPFLIRCRRQATRRLTLKTCCDVYTVKRCDRCAETLRQRARSGATFEILAEEVMAI